MSCTQDDSSDITVNETIDTTFVEKHGGLQVSGNQIINKIGEPVSFAGNSFFWSNDNWGGERFYNSEVVSWLKYDWNTKIVRAAMGVEDPGGYLDNKTANKNRIKTIVEAAIAEGIYVIIDWHSHHAQDNPERVGITGQFGSGRKYANHLWWKCKCGKCKNFTFSV